MPDDTPDRRRDVDKQLDRIEKLAADAHREAKLAREESQATNGKVLRLDRDVTRAQDALFGASEGRIRHGQPGLVDRVNDHGETIRTLQAAHGEASAVGRTFKAVVVVGVSVVTMMVGVITLLLNMQAAG